MKRLIGWLALALCVGCISQHYAEAAIASPSYSTAVNRLVARGYPQKIENYLTSLGTSPLGWRLAGSPADNKAATFIAREMREAGLTRVRLEGVPVDVWDFRGASVTVGNRQMPASIFSGSPPTKAGGVTGEVVYVGAGQAADYASGLDVTDKIVLVDFRPSSGWVDLPIAEATQRGAVGVIITRTIDDPAYWGVAPDALGSFTVTYYSLNEAPSVYVSQESGDWLKGQLKNGSVVATMRNKTRMSLAEDGGKGYNVVGVLPGKKANGPITVVASHHDAYFSGGLDDSASCACMLTMAKAMRMSRYRPKGPVVFLCFTGEEYGLAKAYYQFLQGSWQAISATHPGWAGRVGCMINMEVVGGRHGMVRFVTCPELQSWLNQEIAASESLLPNGARTATPISNQCDAWPFATAGVPVLTVYAVPSDYWSTAYHTQYDTKDLVDWRYLGMNAKLFYRLAKRLDRGVLPYDLVASADRLSSSVDATELTAAGADEDTVNRVSSDVASFQAAAQAFEASAPAIPSSKVSMVNKGLLAIEKAINANFNALSVWDATTYPHQQVLWDVQSLNEAVDALSSPTPDAASALSSLTNVGMTWSGRSYSRDVYAEALSWHAPSFSHLSWGSRAHLAPYLNVMPQWDMIEDEQYDAALHDLEAMRNDELTELNSRLSSLAVVLEEVTRKIEALH